MDIKESTTVTYSEDRGRRYLLTVVYGNVIVDSQCS